MEREAGQALRSHKKEGADRLLKYLWNRDGEHPLLSSSHSSLSFKAREKLTYISR